MGPVFSFLGAVFFGAAAGAGVVYTLAVNLTRLALLSLAAKLTAPKIDLSQAALNKLLTVRSTIQPQAFVYGQDMLSGPLMFANTSGDSNQHLHRLVALTGREIDSFVSFRIDDDDIVIGQDVASASGAVTGGKYAGVLDIDTRTGTQTQTAIAGLLTAFPSNWTANHRGLGWSLFYTRMTQKGNNEAFQSGIPQNLRSLIRGHKVYDPRLDSTNGGAGTHRLSDEATWGWSDNPALCLADWLRWDEIGLGEADNRIDWPLVAEAADVCDEVVAIPGGTQRRYTCNFTFHADPTPDPRVKEILETAMLGRCIFSQGRWRMWAGAAQAATVTLSEAHIREVGSIQLQASAGSTERYNRVRGKFIDPSRNYTANAYPEQRNAAYEVEDNDVRYRTFDFNACNNSFEAQRNAIIKLRQSRNQRVLVYPGNWSCFRIQPGRIVQIDNDEIGLSADKYFVTEWALDSGGAGVDLTLVAENDADWADPLVGDYTERLPTGELLFVGQTDLPVKLSDADIHNKRANDVCTAGVRATANGQLEYSTAAGAWTSARVPPAEWLGTGNAEYFIRAIVNTGTLGVGSVSTWESLATTREYSITQAIPGTRVTNITLQISDRPDGSNILASATFDLSAEYAAPVVSLTDREIISNGEEFGGNDAIASLLLNTDGRLFYDEGLGIPEVEVVGEWYTAGQTFRIGEDFEFRYLLVDGQDFQLGSYSDAGEWKGFLGSSGNNVWRLRRFAPEGPGTTQTVALFQIRERGGSGEILTSATITFTANILPYQGP